MTDRPVALVAHPGAELYGSDRMVLATLRALDAAEGPDGGWETVLVTPTTGPLLDEASATGATVLICPTPVITRAALRPRGLLRLAATALRAAPPGWRLLGAVRPAVVVVNTMTPPLWLLLARLRGIPTVMHVHEAEGKVPLPLQRLLYLPLLLASAILLNSQYSLQVLLRAAPWLRGRCRVVLNAVDGPPAPVEPRVAVIDGPHLLYVGRLSNRKGPHVVIDALAHLRAKGTGARLGLLGSVAEGYDWYERELRAQVTAAGLDHHVVFHGFHPDIWALVADADIIVVSSLVDEPFGNTAVEARLAARPLVVSDTSGLREASEGAAAAHRVPPGDPIALAEAVESLMADWTRQRELALSDAQFARAHFSGDRYAAELRGVVDQVSRR